MLDELTTGLDPQARRDTWELIEGVRDRGVTIVLVTHFMEEAERLCDRVALIDAGRVVAMDTPAALAERVEAEQRIQFRPSVPFDDELLTSLPEVTERHPPGRCRGGHRDRQRAERGHLRAGPHQIVAEQLRVEQASLEDAFVALTGTSAPPSQPHRTRSELDVTPCQLTDPGRAGPPLGAAPAHPHRAASCSCASASGSIWGVGAPGGPADHLRQHPGLQQAAGQPRRVPSWTSTCRS